MKCCELVTCCASRMLTVPPLVDQCNMEDTNGKESMMNSSRELTNDSTKTLNCTQVLLQQPRSQERLMLSDGAYFPRSNKQHVQRRLTLPNLYVNVQPNVKGTVIRHRLTGPDGQSHFISPCRGKETIQNRLSDSGLPLSAGYLWSDASDHPSPHQWPLSGLSTALPSPPSVPQSAPPDMSSPIPNCSESPRRLSQRHATCDCDYSTDVSNSNRVWPLVHSFARSCISPEIESHKRRQHMLDSSQFISGHRRLHKASRSLPLLVSGTGHGQEGNPRALVLSKSLLLLSDNNGKSSLSSGQSLTSYPSSQQFPTATHLPKPFSCDRKFNSGSSYSANSEGNPLSREKDNLKHGQSTDSSCSFSHSLVNSISPLKFKFPTIKAIPGSATCISRITDYPSRSWRSAPTTPELLSSSLDFPQVIHLSKGRSAHLLHETTYSERSVSLPSNCMEINDMERVDLGKDLSTNVPVTDSVLESGSRSGSPLCHSVIGPRFKLLTEGDVQLCRLSHSGTVLNKILSSKLLRRWETHHLFLNDACISSKTPSGFMENSVPYSSIEDINVVAGWDSGHRQCLRLVVPEGCILFQANNTYIRDQWYHSIIWKKNLFRYHQVTRTTTRQEVLLKEVKNMVELAITTPLQDSCIAQAPFQVISSLLMQQNESILPQNIVEDLLMTLSPLLEKQQPSQEMCTAFSRHCQSHPRSSLVRGLFTTVVQRILKHNVDFGKHPHMRRFVQVYIQVLFAHNDGPEAVKEFVRNVHGEGSSCPHPRVLPNLVAVCLAAVFSIYDEKRQRLVNNDRNVVQESIRPKLSKENPSFIESHNPMTTTNSLTALSDTNESRLSRDILCYLVIMNTICEFEDWRPGLAQLLQPIPFPDDALADEVFVKGMATVVSRIGNDPRCQVHQCVLGIREGKEGWFHVVCPSSAACPDDGSLWANILETLLSCCCRRKKFLASMTKLLGACQLLALRDHPSAQEALCLMLEWSLLENGMTESTEDKNTLPLQVATTLQSTLSGRHRYDQLCDRQLHLKKLQQKGGPKKLTLPSRSTDSDLSKLLSCGSFGNLECLSLAFTQVTSACAEHLIKLPSLRYLNLWSTQFGDVGLQLISEHLHKLQVLNLCETPVTDKGLTCLTSLKSLRKLNLNSTNLSAHTFENLKQKLPSLQECDVRYTDAW